MEQEFSDSEHHKENSHELATEWSQTEQKKTVAREQIGQNMDQLIIDNFIEMLKSNLKNSNENDFTLESPKPSLLQKIIQLWQQRGIKTHHCVLRLSIENCTIDRKAIVLLFQHFPSIFVTLNGQKIENSNIFQTKDEIFYEGIQKFLYYYDYKKKMEYIGDVENRVAHGRGFLKCVNQSESYAYHGQFYEGNYHGRGELDNKIVKVLEDKIERVRYVGQFKNDQKHGSGEEFVFRKDEKGKIRKWHYRGKFAHGMREGEGKQTSYLGVYEGSWRDGQRHGKGIFKFKNGDSYDGNWEKGKFHGKGIRVIKGKGLYNGEFVNGLFQGKGVYNYESGDKYDGEFQNNLRSGEGIYTWSDGDYYEGEWRDDKYHGKGNILEGLTFYQGQFKCGHKHGLGELTNQDGNTIKGTWANNNPVEIESN